MKRFQLLTFYLVLSCTHIFSQSINDSNIIHFPKVVIDKSKYDTCTTCNKPYGKFLDNDFDLIQSGEKTILDSGTVYTAKIITDNAEAIRLKFDKFNIKEGAFISIYNPNNNVEIQKYDYKHSIKGDLIKTIHINGSEVILEYFIPDKAKNSGNINLIGIIYVYDLDILFDKPSRLKRLTPCSIDVNCPQGDEHKNNIRSVVYITDLIDDEGAYSCSGVFINNSNNDGTPYILTAHHCVRGKREENLHLTDFYFHYQNITCSGALFYEYTDYVITGAEIKAQRTTVMGGDFALLELSITPSIQDNIYYSGWDRWEPPRKSDVVAIHHPDGEQKSISFGEVRESIFENYIKVKYYEGTTEPGSSGCPLFYENLIVGTNHGGPASNCNDLGWKLFGSIQENWTSILGEGRRLHDWLSPDDKRRDVQEGYDPKSKCVANRHLSGNFYSTAYQPESVIIHAENEIFASHNNAGLNIYSGGHYEFVAGNAIHLGKGFHAQRGCNFHAYIQACNPSIKSTKIQTKHETKENYKEESIINNSDTNKLCIVYPNPTNGIFIIKLYNTQMPVYVKLTTISGSVVYNQQHNTKTIEIDLSDQSKGIYLIKVITDEKNFIKKVIYH